MILLLILNMVMAWIFIGSRIFRKRDQALGQEGAWKSGGNRSKGVPENRVICGLEIPGGYVQNREDRLAWREL